MTNKQKFLSLVSGHDESTLIKIRRRIKNRESKKVGHSNTDGKNLQDTTLTRRKRNA